MTKLRETNLCPIFVTQRRLHFTLTLILCNQTLVFYCVVRLFNHRTSEDSTPPQKLIFYGQHVQPPPLQLISFVLQPPPLARPLEGSVLRAEAAKGGWNS